MFPCSGLASDADWCIDAWETEKFGWLRTGKYVGRSWQRDFGGRALSEPGTIFLIDDDQAVRDSLSFLLETTGFAVKSYPSAGAFLSAGLPDGAGCVITDVRLPGIDGLELQCRLAQAGCTLPVIVITGHSDVPMAVQALKNGAMDFLEKPFDGDALLETVRRAVEASRAASEHEASVHAARERLARLTAREREVLDALVSGQANKEIARVLGVSPRTVEVHRARVMEKLDANSLAELVHLTLAAAR